MCSFLEKRLRARQRDRERERERERDETVFNGPNLPGGRRPNNLWQSAFLDNNKIAVVYYYHNNTY